MNKDYYKLLGIQKNASQDEVKKAFRKLAHEHHPDKQGGDAAKFKEVNEAYGVLSDEKKRAQYDQFGSNFQGGAGGGGFNGGGFDFSGFDFSQGFGGQQGNMEFDLNDILGSFFGGGGGRRRPRKGADLSTSIDLTFEESIFGTKKVIRVRREKKDEEIEINVPSGIDNGESLRMTGKGEPMPEGVPGDLYIKVRVRPNETFKKEGYNLVMNLSIKVTDALLGFTPKIKTLDSDLEVAIPAGIKHGEVLRVKGKGVPFDAHRRGDLFIRISIDMPKKLSKEAKKLIEELKKEGL